MQTFQTERQARSRKNNEIILYPIFCESINMKSHTGLLIIHDTIRYDTIYLHEPA